ncbi:MAG: FGGY family carbohydrate kinase [Pseudomonadota bacterium]|jgi:glycerol kinase
MGVRSELFLGIDQGSSATKGVLIDQTGASVAEWNTGVPEIRREERCVEQDPQGLLASVEDLLTKGIQVAQADGRPLRAWGLGVQRSGVLAWNSESRAVVHPMITWADTRTQPVIDGFARGVEKISGLTGLPTLANFAAPKIHLLQRQFLNPLIYVGTLDTFLLHQLSAGSVFATEDTMAARTMLYALEECGWSDWLCSRFEVDQKRLPIIAPSLSHHMTYMPSTAAIPLMALLGDQQAALIGRWNGTNRPLLNLGTIASICFSTGSQIVRKPALKTSVLYSRHVPGAGYRELQYLIENLSSVTGTVLLEPLRRSWVADTNELDQCCNASYAANPVGLATAYWTNRETITPLWPTGVANVTVCRAGAGIADRVRAVVENVGNIIVRMIDECAEKGLLGERFPAEIEVAGGGSGSQYLMQYIADISGHILHRSNARDAGARGSAVAAWMSVYPKGEPESLGVDKDGSVTFSCSAPERRKRYMSWLRMEQDVLNRTLPAHAEIEEQHQ